jgi:pyruvate dehydrogenase E1 component alpha subunit
MEETKMATPTRQQLLWMYETMVRIRDYEETMSKVYLQGKLPPHIQKGLAFDIGSGPVPGEMHLAAGQEPVAVGVCAHLRDDDAVFGTHRSHHFAIAKGVPLPAMTAEIFGKSTGLGRGKGGHMHLFAPEQKFNCSGIVGANMPAACGAALAAKLRGRDSVAVAFFGEGAINQGAFHESLNLAALWKLAVIFVVEDNQWAISVPKSESTCVASNADRALAYGIPGALIEENDALEVFAAVGPLVERARRGEGPSLIEVKTDRYLGHFEGDPEIYRPKGEVDRLRKNDPIPRLGAHLRDLGLLDDAGDREIVQRVKKDVADAYEFAKASPYPEPQEALQHVFV